MIRPVGLLVFGFAIALAEAPVFAQFDDAMEGEPQSDPGVVVDARPAPPAIDDAAAYAAAQSIGTTEALQAFLRHYPDGFYADLARAALDKMAVPVRVEPASPPPAPTVDAAAELGEKLRQFLLTDFVDASFSDRTRMERIYASEVDYYGLGRVSRATVIADKIKFGKTWDRVHYEMLDGTYKMSPLGNSRYHITFLLRYDNTNTTRRSSGVAESRLIIDMSSGSPRLVSEKSEVVSRD